MSITVLIVDDDPDFRTLARRLLVDAGFAVAGEAGAAAAALSAAMRIKPLAVLVDVELPDGDGWALARQLSALPWRPRIVLTSAYPRIGSTRDVRRAGARAFVHKGDLPTAPLQELFAAS